MGSDASGRGRDDPDESQGERAGFGGRAGGAGLAHQRARALVPAVSRERSGSRCRLRADETARRRRDGSRLCGSPGVDRSRRRREDAQARVGESPGAAREVPGRGGGYRRSRTSEHRSDLRPRSQRGRSALLHDEAGPGDAVESQDRIDVAEREPGCPDARRGRGRLCS